MTPKRLALSTILVAMSAANSALALPDPRTTSTVLADLQHRAGSDPRLQEAAILQDDKAHVIYIGPATRKTEEGAFHGNPSAAACQDLRAAYAVTYLVPNAPPQQWPDEARRGPVSPFFDRNFGIYIRYATLVQNLFTAKDRREAYRREHQDLYTAYDAAKTLFDGRQEQVTRTQSKLDALDASVRVALQRLSRATSDAEKETARAWLEDAKAHKAAEAPGLQATLADTVAARDAVREPYVNAKAAWAPYMDGDADLSSDIETLMQAARAATDLATESFAVAEGNLAREESRIVGTATATVTLYDQEVAAARQLLPSGTDFSVAPLEVFDVALGGPRVSNTISRGTVSNLAAPGASDRQFFDVGEAAFGATSGSAVSSAPSPFDMGLSNWLPTRRVGPWVGPATYAMPVSLGAYCTGSSARSPETYSIPVAGSQAPNTFNGFSYRARQGNVWAESVAIGYRYVERADPVQASCELKFETPEAFGRAIAELPSLFFERRWDPAARDAVKSRGLWCDVTSTAVDPSDPNALEDIRQSTIQDAAAEFINAYGKQWQLTTYTDETVSTAEQNAALRRMGPSRRALCGPRVHCAIEGLVFASLDEIFASTGHRENFQGRLVRDYTLQTSRVVTNAQAAVDLVVRAP